MSFTLTDFLRRAGEVLEAASRSDVRLRRRDADDLVLTTAARQEARQEALGILARVAQGAGAGVAWIDLLLEDDRERFVRELATTAAACASLDDAAPLARLLERWRERARTGGLRPRRIWDTLPVAIPDDVDDPSIPKASGVIELPIHVRWSGPKRTYDLDDERQLRRVYEQVLREGTDDDVRHFIDVDKLVEQWDQLVLPNRVRQGWADWLHRRRGLDLAC